MTKQICRISGILFFANISPKATMDAAFYDSQAKEIMTAFQARSRDPNASHTKRYGWYKVAMRIAKSQTVGQRIINSLETWDQEEE